GSHYITYTAPNYCKDSLPITVTLATKVVITQVPTLFTTSNPVTLMTNVQDDGTFSQISGINNLGLSGNIFDPHASGVGTFSIKYSPNNSCYIADTIDIIVTKADCIAPMLAFTPNGDSHNDTWKVFDESSECGYTISLTVYNRWGALVYHSDNYHNEWTGTYKTNILPDGTYYYKIKATNDTGTRVLTGNVTIIR